MASGFPNSIDNFTDPLTTSPLNSPSHAGQHQDLNDAVNKIETYMGLVKVIPTSGTNCTIAANGTVTIGNAVTTFTVNGAFSSLYNNYKIMISGGSASVSNNLWIRMGATTTGYYSALVGTAYATGATASGGRNNTETFFDWAGYAMAATLQLDVTISNPFLTENTFLTGSLIAYNAGYFSTGKLDNTNSYSDFTIGIASGNMTGGSVVIYGYRN